MRTAPYRDQHARAVLRETTDDGVNSPGHHGTAYDTRVSIHAYEKRHCRRRAVENKNQLTPIWAPALSPSPILRTQDLTGAMPLSRLAPGNLVSWNSNSMASYLVVCDEGCPRTPIPINYRNRSNRIKLTTHYKRGGCTSR